VSLAVVVATIVVGLAFVAGLLWASAASMAQQCMASRLPVTALV
jgi:hypothetical protein